MIQRSTGSHRHLLGPPHTVRMEFLQSWEKKDEYSIILNSIHAAIKIPSEK